MSSVRNGHRPIYPARDYRGKAAQHSTTIPQAAPTPAAPALTASKGLDAGSDTVRKIQLLGVTPFDLPALNAAGLLRRASLIGQERIKARISDIIVSAKAGGKPSSPHAFHRSPGHR